MPGSILYPGQVYPTNSPQTTPFTSTEIVAIRRYAGYQAYASFGYIFQTNMANLDIQLVNMSNDEQAAIRTYLATLSVLETAVISSGANMGTDTAAVWKRNRFEFTDRKRLYDYTRREMCAFIGVSPGPSLGDGGTKVVRS